MTKESRKLAITVAVTMCLTFLFIYSWCHEGPPEYIPGGERMISPTVVLGMALPYFLLSLFLQIRGKK
jgi:hypothetical protein